MHPRTINKISDAVVTTSEFFVRLRYNNKSRCMKRS